MRAFLSAIAVIFVAGCATAPAGPRIAIYDHKYNEIHFVYGPAQSDFVGTSATAPGATKPKTSTYKVGHP